jgi:hypothetical protein
MNDVFVQGSSIVGATLILSAFFANQRSWVTSRAAAYLWANFIGASMLSVVAIIDGRIGFILLEGLWATVSLWSIATRTRQPGRSHAMM